MTNMVEKIQKRFEVGQPRLAKLGALKDAELKKMMQLLMGDKTNDPYLFKNADVIRISSNDVISSIEIVSYDTIIITGIAITLEREHGKKEEIFDLGNPAVNFSFDDCSCPPNAMVEKYGNPHCTLCRASIFGHWCPESHDHECHYFTKDGVVKFRDGTIGKMPTDHDVKYETDDECLFCGKPEERK